MNKNKNKLSDEDLILQFQNGDSIAFNLICERYSNRLVNFIFRFVYDMEEAEDLAQDTLIKVYKNKNSYKSIAKFSTWIYTIAGNFAKTELRKKKRRKTYSNSELVFSETELIVPDSSNESDKEILNQSLKSDLKECLSDLPLE